MNKFHLSLLSMFALAACQPDTFGRSDAEIRDEEKQCLADGGEFKSAGFTDAKICFRNTSDVGQSCSRESDCESLCLASPETGKGQCAAVTPMFGCHEIFDENGDQVALCIE